MDLDTARAAFAPTPTFLDTAGFGLAPRRRLISEDPIMTELDRHARAAGLAWHRRHRHGRPIENPDDVGSFDTMFYRQVRPVAADGWRVRHTG